MDGDVERGFFFVNEKFRGWSSFLFFYHLSHFAVSLKGKRGKRRGDMKYLEEFDRNDR